MSLVQQLYGVQPSIFMCLSVEKLVGDTNLVKVHHWMPPPVEGLPGDNFLYGILVQCCALSSTGFSLYQLSF